MGGRLSVPQSTDKLSEISRPTPPPRRYKINSRTIVAPAAAFTMACLLFFYSRTSIQAARLNAQRHREADGGQISWRNESLRRHGQLDKIGEGDGKLIREAFRERPVTSKDLAREKVERGEGPGRVTGLSDSEQARALERYKVRQKRRAGGGGDEQ